MRLESGEHVRARAVVVATDAPSAATLLGIPPVVMRAASCVYFSAPTPPFDDPLIALDGARSGPAKNVAVLTNLSRHYAPEGQALIVAAVPGALCRGPDGTLDDGNSLADDVRKQLRGWFGDEVENWRHLRTYRIAAAHPDQRPPFDPKQPVRLNSHHYVCGDHRDTASIQGALYSGRRTARAISRDLG